MLGPLLFAMHTSPVSNLISAHNLHHHQYADDTQLYMAVRPSVNVTNTGISECVADVSRWFLENGLLLNPTKTEAVLFGTRAQSEKMPTACGLNITGTVVPFHDTVKLLGVTLDSSDDGPARRWSSAQLQLPHACTASHPSSTDIRR